MSPGMAWPRTRRPRPSGVKVAASLEDAVAGAELVQESGPERLEVKRDVFARLDAARRRRSDPRHVVLGHRHLALRREA